MKIIRMKIGFIAESKNSDEMHGVVEHLKYLRSHTHVKKNPKIDFKYLGNKEITAL
jgi:hypothetical protein